MAEPLPDIKIFQFVSDSIFGAFQTATSGAVGSSISAITGIAVAMTAIYYCMFGYQMISGRIQAPLEDFVKSASKFLLISFFALNAAMGGFNPEVQRRVQRGLLASLVCSMRRSARRT